MRNSVGSLLERLKGKYLEIEDTIKDLNVEISRLEEYLTHISNNDYEFKYSEILFKDVLNKYSFIEFQEALEINAKFANVDEPQVHRSREIINDIKTILNKKVNEDNEKLKLLEEEYQKEKSLYQKYQVILINLSQSDLDENELEKLVAYLYQNGISKDEIRKVLYQINIKVEDRFLPSFNDEEIDEIESYINQYNQLSDQNKKIVLSAKYFISTNNLENLENISYDLSKNEIIYYYLINSLSEKYHQYQENTKEENLVAIKNDLELFEVLKLEVDDAISFIRQTLIQIQKLEEEIESDIEKETSFDAQADNKRQNLVIFLDTSENKVDGTIMHDDVIKFDIKNIDDKVDGGFENDMTMILRLLNNKLLEIPSVELRRLGPKYNKPLFNAYHSGYTEFDSFNVYCLKNKGHNPARITYLTMPISKNNRNELIKEYNLKEDFQLYLVLGVFTKKNDDSEYVRITHNRLAAEKTKIVKLMQMLSTDFTLETKKEVMQMIDNGLTINDELNNEYLTKGETL